MVEIVRGVKEAEEGVGCGDGEEAGWTGGDGVFKGGAGW